MDYNPNTTHSSTSALNAGQDAKNAAADAGEAVTGAASEVADQATQSASKVVDQVQQAGAKAINATKADANNAVDAAGRKVSDIKSQLEPAKTSATGYINDDPVRAVKMAAIGGALLSAALVMLTRR